MSVRSAASRPVITSPPTTAPHPSKLPQETVKSIAYPGAGTGTSTTPSTWPLSAKSATRADGRAYYRRKIDEGMSPKSALRSLKCKVSDALYSRMIADARRTARRLEQDGPGRQTGNDSASSATGSHPNQLFGKATPGPGLTLNQPHLQAQPRARRHPSTRRLPQRGLGMHTPLGEMEAVRTLPQFSIKHLSRVHRPRSGIT